MTSDGGLLRVSWRLREPPLEPVAVAAAGEAAVALARRLLEFSDDDLRRLKGVGGSGLILALGEAQALPWVPGVRYLGLVEGKHPLLLPTTHEPDLPLDLFGAAIRRQLPSATYPLAILPESSSCVPISEARPLCRDTLRRWLSGEIGP